MGHFSIRVVSANGKPLGDIGVMIDYGLFHGCDEKRTHGDGWVEFHNHEDRPGKIWVHGRNMGDHSLADGKSYSYTL